MAARPRLTLIDGYAVMHRQYEATRTALETGKAFRTASGEPTNAVHGFARTILDVLQDKYPPEFLAVVFDQGLSGREVHHAEYKTNRKALAESLEVQVARIYQLVRAFNIPILEVPGYEADDVIGTVAKQASAEGLSVYIITVDGDLLQLIDDNVTVELPTYKGGNIIYNAPLVMEKKNIRPDQVADYKALVGDTSDNYPGVNGIGDKTAVDLLREFDTLDNIYASLDKITKKAVREKLIAGRENAFLSQRLARIMTDLPIQIEIEKCLAKDFDPLVVDALFAELEFRSLRARLDIPRDVPVQPEYNGTESTSGADYGYGNTAKPLDAPTAPLQIPLFESADFGEPDTAETLAGTADSNLDSNGELVATGKPGKTPSPDLTLPVREVFPTITVDTEEKLTALLDELNRATVIAFDTETSALDQVSAQLVGISLSTDVTHGEVGYYVPVGHRDGIQLPIGQVIAALTPAMTDPAKQKVAHNAVYDLSVMIRAGLNVTPITFDTMIAAWLLTPEATNMKGLKDQARLRLGAEMVHIQELIGKGGKNQLTMDQVPIPRAAPYAAADAVATYQLLDSLRGDLQTQNLYDLFNAIEIPLIPVIADLNLTGTKLDLPYLAELSVEFTGRLEEKAERIYALAGERFSIGSLKQLNEIFFARLHFDKLKVPRGTLRKSQHGYSLDAATMDALAEHHPLPAAILEWRSLEKLKNTYVDAFPTMVDANGRIHTTYNQTGAVTGRISSDSPNLQNIPIRTEEGRRVRKAFVASEGHTLLGCDYSQIELRLLADFSDDPFLINAFNTDQDIHKATAAAVRGIPLDQVTKEERYFAKRVNFGLMYGMGASRLAREAGDMSRAEASAFIDEYFKRLPGIKTYFDTSRQLAYDQGYLLTKLGRKRDFSALSAEWTRQNDRARMEREAINMPVQGTAADIIKIAMARLWRRLKDEHPDSHLILQVHDELVLEVPTDKVHSVAAVVKEVMESAVTLKVPLRAETNIGTNWAEMQLLE